MSYGLIYTIPFAAQDNTPCVVEIEKDGYTGSPTELQAGAEPFRVEIADDEFLYEPTRFSTAQIQVVGNDYLRNIYSTDYRQFRVTFKRAGLIIWCGFVKPEAYTQDYASSTFTLEIECASAMSVLEHIDYKKTDPEKTEFVTLWSLLQRCVTESRGRYDGVVIPYVYARDAASYAKKENVFEQMRVSEQNFLSEDGQASTLKDILEDICRLFGWTCADWQGYLYFVDIDHTGEYHLYTGDMSRLVGIVSRTPQEIQTIGIAGASHSLDILPGYNKVTVKCSNYPIENLLPKEDYESLNVLNVDEEVSMDAVTVIRSEFLQPSKWDCWLHHNGKLVGNDELATIKDTAASLPGAMMMRYCKYDRTYDGRSWVPDIADYEYTNTVRVRRPEYGAGGAVLSEWYKVMSFRAPAATYYDGAIGVDTTGKIVQSQNMLPWYNSAEGQSFRLAIQLRIGDKYYGAPRGDQSQGYKWSTDASSIALLKEDSINRDGSADWVSAYNEKRPSMPYKGLRGLIIPINEALSGELEFTLLTRARDKIRPGTTTVLEPTGVLLQNFSVKYKRRDGSKGSDGDNREDRIYENVINESYINELDTIKLSLSSYNEDGACYGKITYPDGYLTRNLYNSILGKDKRPEELLITRIINHYGAPLLKLTEEVKAAHDITPITVLSDRFAVNKKFINAGGTIDYRSNVFKCIMIEI